MRKSLQYVVLVLLLSLWSISLLMVYLPISRWVIPVFPLTEEYNYKLLTLLISAALSSMTSLCIGLSELRRKS